MQRIFRCLIFLALTAALTGQFGWVMASDGNPAGQTSPAAGQPQLPDTSVMTIRLPKDLTFPPQASGAQKFVLYGDPDKPGSAYEVLQKWNPHSMSHPHFHRNDRYIYVVSGTWWVGAGTKYDPDSTYPVPAGSFVHHIGREIHYDGAKDESCILLISGIGPVHDFPPADIKLPLSELDKRLNEPEVIVPSK
jgi:quercetin dioxygenase-like cupin family protein